MSDKEEFEFKPLTEGLGFHKKTMILEEQHQAFVSQTGILPKPKTQAAANFIQMQNELFGDDRLDIIEKPSIPKTQAPTPTVALSPKAAPVPAWKAALTKKEIIEPKTPVTLELIAVSWPAIFFDTLMVMGLCLLFSAAVFALTKIELGDLLDMLVTNDVGAWLGTATLIFSVYEVYSVTCRSFFGKTMGEWAFHLRLGTPEDQQKFLYPVRVAWRSLVVALSGFIWLPVLSAAFGRDIGGLLSGVSLLAEKE